ncbi:FG-GAP-like repeat-containing protein [Candidatus Njordibacter sp. Uisw_058]|uniref:FG-GAP-like repeat-containing protein n=1 Tax=Candidatus Njordibacter sp. Uisw_058 TaxID=3230974 RepID=UPI003D3BC991
MSTYYGTDGDDVIDGSLLNSEYGNIDSLDGDDHVTLGLYQAYISGLGNDVVTSDSPGAGYGLWFVKGEVYINLAEGWALDGLGYKDELQGIHTIHMPNHGGTVVGSDGSDTVFSFGGNSHFDLGSGIDIVHMPQLNSEDFVVRQTGAEVTINSDQYAVTLKNVETLKFADRTINLTKGRIDGKLIEAKELLYEFVETEVSEGWWYQGVYNEPSVVNHSPLAGSVVDIGADNDLDLIIPVNRGYRSGADTRSHFQVFENIDGELRYSAELTSLTPFIAGAGRTDTIYLERFQTDAFVTTNSDTAIETETRTDIPWRFGDISITRLDQFEVITNQLVPENTLPHSDDVNRYSAVNAHAMAVGDINGDGMDDILVGDYEKPFALLQTLSGDFEYRTDPVWTAMNLKWIEPTIEGGTSAFPLDMAMADYNGDGFDDILFGRGHGTTLSRIVFNDGAGNFSHENSEPLPASAYGHSNNLHLKTLSHDFDSDGDIDIVILNSRHDPWYGGNYLQYLTNNGGGQFTDETELRLVSPSQYPDTYLAASSTIFWHVLDVDNDGDLDIAGHRVGESSNVTGIVFSNDGKGQFTLESITNPSQGIILGWGDFNNDGNLDTISFSSRHNNSEGTSSTNKFWLNTINTYSSSVSQAFDIESSNSAGGIYRTYKAAFNRTPDNHGLGYWIDRADNGASAVQMAEEFVWSAEFQTLYGVTTSDNYLVGNDIEAVVDLFYRNVLGRAPDQGGLTYYTSTIEDQNKTGGQVLAEIADSAENRANLLPTIENGMSYDLWVA